MTNPHRGTIEGALEKAHAFRKRFHWGRPGRSGARKATVSELPRVLTKLGKLESLVYVTNKEGDGLSEYEHSFGEEGGRKPDLAVDPETGRLHIVGGGYRVEQRGIVD